MDRIDAESELTRLRDAIDRVDEVIIKLLNQRAKYACEIGEIKAILELPIYVPEREKQVLAHVRGVDGSDDGAVGDGDDEGGAVDEHDGRARALGRGAVDAVAEALQRRLAHVDAAALEALQGVAREGDVLGLRLQDVGEGGALDGRRVAGAARSRGRRRRPRRRDAGRQQRGVVDRRAHCAPRTPVTATGGIPSTPSIVSVGPSCVKATFWTTPVAGVPSRLAYVTVLPISEIACWS